VARWWSDCSLRTKGLLVLALPLMTFVASALVFLLVLSQMDRAQGGVTEARRAQSRLAQVYLLVLDGETGIRGYLATGDQKFLGSTSDAKARLPAVLDALTDAIGDHPSQAARLDRVRTILAAGYQLDPPSATLRSDPAAVRSWLDAQKESTDEFRTVLADVWRTEDRLLSSRLDERNVWIERGRITTLTALGLGLFGGLAAMLALTLGVSRRLERVVARTDGLRQGEAPDFIDPGKDEIGVLSRRLTEVASRWLLWKSEAHNARVAAEAANQAKSEFLSRMSHELRTPLNAVLGFTQLLAMDLPESQQDSVRQIRRAGVHLLNLINEVLDISRIEAGQLALSPEPVRVADIVSEVVDLMGPIAAERAVTIRSDGALAGDCHVLADRQRTKQIILNLASNAVKYNNRGGNVVVKCRVEDGEVVLEVIDDGIGIAEADLDRLFIPFERLGAANSEVEGTGVGLAISQRLACAMNGRIEVSSTLGRGSTFRLHLPVTEAADPVAPTALPEAPPRAGGAGRRDAVQTVLSVEDNPANIRLLQEIVSRRPDWRLRTAGQGQLGLDLATADPPDLILLDLHLPDMRGEEVLRRLKADVRTAEVPVVVVSADATPGQVDRLRAAGAETYLTKPIEVTRLLTLLDQASVQSSRAGD
jgi:signal transduction histidine kinase/CheY-like chemotaxis protein